MTDKLPPNLLALFAPRPPLRWVPPCDFPPEQRKTAAIGGVADFLPHLEAYKDADGYVPTESWLQARDRKKLEKKAEIEKLVTEAPKLCKMPSHPMLPVRQTNICDTVNPANDPNIRGDAFKTLMVSRLSYDANEEDLEREFGRVGTIERVCVALHIIHTYLAFPLTSSIDQNRSGQPCRREGQQEEKATPRLRLHSV